MRPAVLVLVLGCSRGPAREEHAHEEHEEHEQHGATPGAVELRPAAVEAARLRVEPAREGALTTAIERPARVALPPDQEAAISAWTEGQVDGIRASVGQPVKAGQVLATVQTPELGEAIGTWRAADARHEAAEARLERLRSLEAQGVSSRAQVLEAEAEHAEAEGSLEAAEERLRVMKVDPGRADPHQGEHYPSHIDVRSPIAGEVLTADAAVGQPVSPGTLLFRVGNLDEVWVLADIYEQDLARVKEGDSLRFVAEAWPGQVFSGTVSQVASWVDPRSRTIELRAVVPNPDHRLKPNLFGTARIEGAEAAAPTGIVLPADAVQEIGGQTVVFIEESSGRFLVRPVEVAGREGDRLRLAAGVQPGEPVVVEGAFALKSELEKDKLGEGHAH